MPRAKRPLSEVNPNASNASSASRKSAKIEPTKPPTQTQKSGASGKKEAIPRPSNRRKQPSQQPTLPLRNSSQKWSTIGTVFQNTDHPREHEQSKAHNEQKERMEYRNKDNSKLRSFLYDRNLPTCGTRQELISRLENSSINYEELSSEKITEMLKRRHLTMASLGNKQAKIERLRLNDKVDRDTGNSENSMLYAKLSVAEEILVEKVERLANSENLYTFLEPTKLSSLLQRRNLSTLGSKSVLLRRLQNDEAKTITKEAEAAQVKYDIAKLELESTTGRSVNVTETFKKEDNLTALDHWTQDQAQEARPKVPICDYDWKESHWADRRERELAEICSRRGMPGCGPKAAMLKWLDTGNLDYEDMYIGGLTSICMERGLECRSKDKKVDLIRRLREADEAE
jgi:hypothetical protein